MRYDIWRGDGVSSLGVRTRPTRDVSGDVIDVGRVIATIGCEEDRLGNMQVESMTMLARARHMIQDNTSCISHQNEVHTGHGRSEHEVEQRIVFHDGPYNSCQRLQVGVQPC